MSETTDVVDFTQTDDAPESAEKTRLRNVVLLPFHAADPINAGHNIAPRVP